MRQWAWDGLETYILTQDQNVSETEEDSDTATLVSDADTLTSDALILTSLREG